MNIKREKLSLGEDKSPKALTQYQLHPETGPKIGACVQHTTNIPDRWTEKRGSAEVPNLVTGRLD